MSNINNYYCRLCAEELPKFRLISENSSNKRRLDEYVLRYVPIKFENTYDYAKHVCVDCANVILNFHAYVKKVEAAQTKLCSLLVNDTVTIKTQPPEFDEDEEIPLSNFQDESKKSPFKDEDMWLLWDANASNNSVDFKEEIDLEDEFHDNNLENIFFDSKTTPLIENAPLANNLDAESNQEQLVKPAGRSKGFKRHRIWECYRCSAAHVRSEALQKHFESTHNMPVEFMCYKCQALFVDVNGYKRHLSKDHGINLTANSAGRYECKTCGFVSNRSTNFRHHMLTHSGIKKFKCNVCERTFALKQHLRSHSLTHREEIPVSSTKDELPRLDPSLFSDQFKCFECTETFNKLDLLEKHMKKTHKDMLLTFNCPRCDTIAVRKNDLAEHLKNDHKRYKCQICSKEISNKTSFIDHIYVHKGVKQFSCDLCDKTFTRKQHAKLHRLQHDKPVFNCDKCEKKFSSEVLFQVHQKKHERKKRSVHNQVERRLHECDICQKKFVNKCYINDHKKLIHGENIDTSLVCSKCGKAFKLKGLLVAHEATHVTVNTFHCDKCPKVLKSMHTLKIHKKLHESTESFKCNMCGNEFKHQRSLRRHLRVHENMKPFECEYCKKTFREKNYLKVHLRQHTGEKPYKCLECNHSFTSDSNFIKHLRGRHGLQKVSIANNHQYPFINPPVNC